MGEKLFIGGLLLHATPHGVVNNATMPFARGHWNIRRVGDEYFIGTCPEGCLVVFDDEDEEKL